MARATLGVRLLVGLACAELVGIAVLFSLGVLPGGASERSRQVRPRTLAGKAAEAPDAQRTRFWGPAGHSTLRLYHTPSSSSQPTELVGDGRGGYWFTEQGSNKLGHVSLAGRFREYRVPTANSQPFALALDASGRVWFTELAAGKVGRIDPSGRIVEFSLHSPSSQPYALALGSDGKMWFTEYAADTVGNVDSEGRLNEYRLPTSGASPAGIAFGADRNMWVTESGYLASKLAKVTPAGRITEYPLPTPGAQPFGITASRRTLWFTEFGAGKIASASLSGHVVEYPIPTPGATPFKLIVTPDGQVWFTEPSIDGLGRLSFRHGHETIVEYPLPQRADALDLAPGQHGTVWTTEFLLDSVGSFTP